MDIREEKFDILVLAGQSNAEGGGAGDNGYVPSENVYILRGDFQASVKEGEYGNQYLDLVLSKDYYVEVAKNYEKDGVLRSNFSYFVAKEYEKKFLQKDRKVLIVQTAIGGTGFSKKHWGVGDILHERMVNMINYALSLNPENRLVGLLWHQGEHDSFEQAELSPVERERFYFSKLKEFLSDFRMRFGNIPFVCAGFTKAWYTSYEKECESIYRATQNVVDTEQNAIFIQNTFDLLNNKEELGINDEVHFCNRALAILGKRYFDALSSLIK